MFRIKHEIPLKLFFFTPDSQVYKVFSLIKGTLVVKFEKHNLMDRMTQTWEANFTKLVSLVPGFKLALRDQLSRIGRWPGWSKVYTVHYVHYFCDDKRYLPHILKLPKICDWQLSSSGRSQEICEKVRGI